MSCCRGFVPADVMGAIEREHITGVTLVPTMIAMLMQQPDVANRDFSSRRTITYGASPMPEALLREALTRFEGVRFSQAYGMTELSPLVSFLGPDDHRLDGPIHRLRSAGRPVSGIEVRIVDAEVAFCRREK
jgi:long-chain acyl-CoA synthetase